jgi:hypothetical protein
MIQSRKANELTNLLDENRLKLCDWILSDDLSLNLHASRNIPLLVREYDRHLEFITDIETIREESERRRIENELLAQQVRTLSDQVKALVTENNYLRSRR